MAKRSLEIVITGDSRGASRAFRGVERDAGTLTGRLKNTGRAVTRTFAAFGAAYGAQAAIRAVGRETIEFDKAMRNVNSIAQLSERRFDGVKQSVLDLAGPTAQSPVKLAEGLYDLVSSGFEADQALRILKSSANAATAGLTTTEVSTKAVAAVLNAYQQPARKAGDVSDVLFRTVDRGVISFEELAETVGDVLPFASSLDVGLREVGASVATMTKAGIGAPETMTRIKNVMVTMLKPGTALSAAIKELGYESGEALVNQEGFQGALEDLTGTTDGSKQAIAALFPNIRALGGVLALTGKNTAQAEQDLRGMRDAAGSTARALAEQSKSVSFQWNRMKASAEVLAIEMGSKLVPVANELLNVLSDPSLSNDQKLKKIATVFGDQIETAAIEIPKILADAAPQVVGAGVILGSGLARGVVTGFIESDLLGKVLIGAAAVRIFGGAGALGKLGGAAGGLIGKGAAKAMPASMVASLTNFAGAALLSGGGLRGIGSAMGGVLGSAGSKAMASSLVKGVPIAAAGLGLATTAKAALDGDWKEVGFSGGAAVVGGLLGSLGGPMGAVLGAGIGASLGGPLESAFDSIFGGGKNNTIARHAELLAKARAEYGSLGVRRREITGAMVRSNNRLIEADQRARVASRGLREAEQNHLAIRRKYGPNSQEAIRAEARLAIQKERSIRATREQRRAERLHGIEKQAAMAMYRQEFAAARRNLWILQQEAQRKRRNFRETKRDVRQGIASQADLAKSGRNLLRAEREVNQAQVKKARLIGDMSSKIGPKWVRQLQNMGQTQLDTGKKIRVTNIQIGNLTRNWGQFGSTAERVGGKTKSGFGRAERSVEDFADASTSMRRRANNNMRLLGPVHSIAIDDVLEDFSRGKSAIDGASGPAIAKRRGGPIGRRGKHRGATRMVPVRLSPGERVDYGHKSFIVPGTPEPKDSFYTQLPESAVVYTFDGQARLAQGEPPGSVLKTQAPHFRAGGVVRPRIIGGSSGGRGVANKSLGEVHSEAAEELKRLRSQMISGGNIVAVGKELQRLGYEVGEHPAFGGVAPVHSDGSYHYQSRAIDVNDDASPRGGSEMASLDWLYPRLARLPHAELLWRVADHYDHLHFAMRNGGAVGSVVRGSATWFNGGATAGGSDTSRPGVSLNPGTWNSPLTRHWRDSSLAGNPYYARVTVGGKSAVLPITDMGPADWTGHRIDVTEGGLAKMGYTTSNFPSGTEGTAKILGTQADRAQAVKQAGRRRQGVKRLWNRIKRKGTTAAGRERAELATKWALKAMKSAKRFNLDDFEEYIEKSKDFQELAYGGIRRRQAQKRRAARREAQGGGLNSGGKGGTGGGGGGWGGSGGGTSRSWNPGQPFSTTNAPGTNKLPKGINDLLGMTDLSWDAKRGILDTALARAEATDTKVDDAAALRAIFGMEVGRRDRNLGIARNLAGKIRTAGGRAEAERLAGAARKHGQKANSLQRQLERELNRKKPDKEEVEDLRKSLKKRRDAQRKAQAEAARIRKMIERRETALENVGSATSEINQVTQGLKDLNESTESGGGSASDLAEEIKALRETIAKQTAVMSQAGTIDRLELERALADLMSGLLAGTMPVPHGGGFRPEANF